MLHTYETNYDAKMWYIHNTYYWRANKFAVHNEHHKLHLQVRSILYYSSRGQAGQTGWPP